MSVRLLRRGMYIFYIYLCRSICKFIEALVSIAVLRGTFLPLSCIRGVFALAVQDLVQGFIPEQSNFHGYGRPRRAE